MVAMVAVVDTFILGNKGLWTLFHLKFARHIAGYGDGSGDRSTGADGDDKFIEVPLGTVVRDKETERYCLRSLKMARSRCFLEVEKEVWELAF
jgi:GTPase involved in cell partitioning and DNA repair